MSEAQKKFNGPFGLQLTSIKVYPFRSGATLGHIRGLAEVQFNDCLSVRGLRIMEGPNGLFVSYPLDPFYKGEDYRSIVTPDDTALRSYIEDKVLAMYEALKDTLD